MTDPAQLYAQLTTAFMDGRWAVARDLSQQLIPFAPRHAGVFGIAGVVHLELGEPDHAAAYLQNATQLDPSRADFATLHAKALAAGRRMSEALVAADRAMEMIKDDSAGLDTLGVIYAQGERHDRAVEAFARAVTLTPTHAPFRFNLATALLVLGDIDGAERELDTCVAQDPSQWPAHLALSQIRTQTPAMHHVERLLALANKYTGDKAAQTYLHLALAKEYEDLGDYPRAFNHFVQGKAIRRQDRPYHSDRDRALFDALIRAFPVPQEASAGDASREPIFIIGMPRSGTTLVERILSSHPDVHAAGELQNFGVALQQVSQARAPFLFSQDLPARTRNIDWNALGSSYVASTRSATGHTARFIDKLPHNFLYAGFIARALPNAKIICLRRGPLDTCLSNFRQLFDHTSMHFDYSCDLLDTGRYYVQFDRLMQHWATAFPGRILSLRYEDLVQSPEPVMRHMLDFCELPWHDDCLNVEKNASPVATFSAAQVRQPVNKASLQRWKCYDDQLAGLREILSAGGIALE